jgi:hypothetical protein
MLVGPAQADGPQDTATALAETLVPVHDRVEMAKRLLGVTEIALPPTKPVLWQTGDTQTFWVTDEYTDREFQVEAELRTIGEHIYFWVESGAEIDQDRLDSLTRIFDQEVYDKVRQLRGSEASPGIDGDPRIHGLFAYGQGPFVAAYFSSDHSYPVEVVPNSNEHEMFFLNLDTLGTEFPPRIVAGIVAHEFQHMIQDNVDSNETSWLNEGSSSFTELYAGFPFDSASTVMSFLSQPGTQLNTWPENSSRIQHYGAAMLFVTYFYDRFGEAALRELGNNQAEGLTSFNEVLRALDEGDVDSFFADWVLANYLQDRDLGDGRYAYQSLPILASPPPFALVRDLPYTVSRNTNQYATDYVMLTHLADVENLQIRLEMPQTVRLVPTDAASGRVMWYSNMADNSDTMLTRRFDLRQVAAATLNFKLWYHIEELWDYGYVMVSSDEGATWTVLQSETMTLENPHHTAYGPGYTGSSNGWLDESIPLDDFAGEEILLRFEMITDQATTQPGMLIDDVGIREIDYFSDFEADDGGWEARGWIRTDNVLPQQVWVQAMQWTGSDVEISRWLAPAESEWRLPLSPEVEQVVLAISPFAPVTRVPMAYDLAIDADASRSAKGD